MELLWPLLVQLGWQRVIVVTDNRTEGERLLMSKPASCSTMRHMLVTGDDVMSGKWLRDVIKTGDISWQRVYILMICSLACVDTSLNKASQLGQEMGTQTAFAMTSRWLWLKTGSVRDVEFLDVKNITMNNVAALELFQAGRTCKPESVLQSRVRTLLWTQSGRRWTTVKPNFMALSDWRLREKLSASNDSSYSSKDTGVSELLNDILFPNVKYGFNGRHLRVITKEWLSYIESRTKNGTKMWSGFLLDLLEVVSHSLNFTYDLVEPEDGVWGTGTATNPNVGFFGQVINKKVDIGLGATDRIYERSLLMDFSYPVGYSPIAMVYKKPPPNSGWWVLFNPLSTHLLAAVGGSLAAVTFCICILEMSAVKPVPGMQDGPRGLKRAVKVFGAVFFVTGGAALLKPTEELLQSRPARVLLLSWWMVTLVVAAAYSGTLTAFLSVAKQPELFSHPRDLVTKQHDYQWGCVGSSSSALLLESSNDTILRQVWEGIQRFAASDPDVITNNVNVLTSKVRKGNFVIFQTELFAFEIFGEDCDVERVNANIKIGMSAIVFPKGSALMKPVSDIILRLESSGLLGQWTDRWFPRARCPAPLGPTVISMQHVLGLSLLLPLGVGLALLLLTVEKRYTNYSGTLR